MMRGRVRKQCGRALLIAGRVPQKMMRERVKLGKPGIHRRGPNARNPGGAFTELHRKCHCARHAINSYGMGSGTVLQMD